MRLPVNCRGGLGSSLSTCRLGNRTFLLPNTGAFPKRSPIDRAALIRELFPMGLPAERQAAVGAWLAEAERLVAELAGGAHRP